MRPDFFVRQGAFPQAFRPVPPQAIENTAKILDVFTKGKYDPHKKDAPQGASQPVEKVFSTG